MKTLALNDMPMPVLGFGTWQLDGDVCFRATSDALEIGYRHIDTAQAYENEAQVGAAITASGVARQELFLTTKLWATNLTPERVLSSLEESLGKLRTDYVDLLLIHWPSATVPLKETLDAMGRLVEKEKANSIGVSNFPVKQMREAVEACKAPIACNQVEYHAMLRQDAVLDYARRHSIAITAYSPLARGRLAKNPLLIELGGKYGKEAGQIALRWLLQQNNVAAIPKAASKKNAQLNFDIFDFELSPAHMQAISALGGDNRYVNPGFSSKWDVA